jgi:hypothetical protein
MKDGLVAKLADAVGPELNALERLVDLVKGVLLLREEAEGEVAVIRVAAGIRLVHAKGACLAAFRTGAEGIAGDAAHGVKHAVAQLEQLLLLALEEGVLDLDGLYRGNHREVIAAGTGGGFRLLLHRGGGRLRGSLLGRGL